MDKSEKVKRAENRSYGERPHEDDDEGFLEWLFGGDDGGSYENPDDPFPGPDTSHPYPGWGGAGCTDG